MFYKVLGMLVWNGGKVLLRQKYGRSYALKPLLAAGGLAIVGGVAIFVSKRDSG